MLHTFLTHNDLSTIKYYTKSLKSQFLFEILLLYCILQAKNIRSKNNFPLIKL